MYHYCKNAAPDPVSLINSLSSFQTKIPFDKSSTNLWALAALHRYIQTHAIPGNGHLPHTVDIAESENIKDLIYTILNNPE